VRYFDDKVCYVDDEISYIFTLAILWWVCVGGYYGWVGNGGVLYRPCSVSIIASKSQQRYIRCGTNSAEFYRF
jgi:hypothetical protein